MPTAGTEASVALVGVKLGGRFRLLRRVADGALGALYEGTDDAGATFAVKVIRREVLSDDGLSRFLRTASVMATARATCFVPVIDVGHDLERDVVFVVTPFVRSESFAALLGRTGALPPQAALRLALQSAEAVAEAHALDIVHRNVKPSNLFADVLQDGTVHVRLADHAIGRSAVGEVELLEVSGSYRYLSPEQATSSKTADRRTDVHGLGVTLHELLSGAPLWLEASSSHDLVSAIRSGDPPAIQDRAPWIDAATAAIVDRAVRCDPQRRFPSAEAFAKSVRALLAGDERLTSEMLVPLDTQARSRVEARGTGGEGEAFAPGIATSGDPAAVADGLIGHRLGGRYTILRLLGRGGMGAVYEIEDANGGRFAAKVILRDMADREAGAVARFLREGRAATRIQDPHVTRTLELGSEMKLGVPFIVMELLTGRDLRSLLSERGAVAALPLLRVFLQAARGLASAHAEGVVHRDIKPANIFLHTGGDDEPITVKICDFGLAKSVEEVLGEHSSYELTRSGGVLGTPHYMSPEHAVNAKSVDARADIWSLSASLFEGLTGRRLWGEPTSLGELLAAICSKTPPRLRDVAPGLDPAVAAAVDKGLAHDRSERWASVDEMIRALEPLVDGTERVTMRDLARVVPARLGIRVDPKTTERALDAASPSQRAPDAETFSRSGQHVAGEPLAAPLAKRPISLRRATLGVLLLLLAAGVVIAARRSRRAAPAPVAAVTTASPDVGPPDFGSTMSSNPAATGAYRAAIQAWRDAATQAAREKLDEALRLDPTFAAAHLRSVVISRKPSPAAREHAKAASELRGGLSEHDRALLNAYLPWMGVSEDMAATIQRLSALVSAQPEDADYAFALCRMLDTVGEFPAAQEACSAALRSDPQHLEALRMKGMAVQALGNEAEAMKLYVACFDATQMGTTCLRDLVMLQETEGRCEDAATSARKWISAEPTMPDPHRYLALALYGAGEPDEAVREVLARSVEPGRQQDGIADEDHLSAGLEILSGEFARAEVRVTRWEDAVAKNSDEGAHVGVADWELPLLIETGRNEEASKAATTFFKRRSAWTHVSVENSLFLRALQLRLGTIDDTVWRASQAEWLAERFHDTDLEAYRSSDWADGYAYSVRDSADAIHALEALPKFPPLIGGAMRDPSLDEAIARVYLLAGRPAESLPFAERAAHTCLSLAYPMENTRAFLHLGHAFEALGDASKACADYAVVVQRWGRDPRSVSAKDASAALARLGCATNKAPVH